MDAKELRHMGRTELIEIISQYQKNEEELKAEIHSLQAQLADRIIKMENAGSIAEAALALNGVFDAAQAAAEQYLVSIQKSSAEAERTASEIIGEARREAQDITQSAEQSAAALRQKAEQECLERRQKTDADCAAMREQITQILKAHEALRSLINT